MTTLTQQIKAAYYMSLIIYVYIYYGITISKCSKNMWIWRLGTWISGEHDSVSLMVRLT